MRACLRRLLTRLRSRQTQPGLHTPADPSTVDGRAGRIALLIDADVDGDELDAAIAAASVDERRDAQVLLGLALELAVDEVELIRLRQAFLEADGGERER